MLTAAQARVVLHTVPKPHNACLQRGTCPECRARAELLAEAHLVLRDER